MATIKAKLTAAERRAGIDLRDVLGARKTRKPRAATRKAVRKGRAKSIDRRKAASEAIRIDRMRASEATLLSTLCQDHGYSFSDTLPSAQRTVMMLDRRTNKISASYAVKLLIPSESALGEQIALLRARKPARKAR